MGASREPGIRAKFAVASSDSDIDPVGACVGMKGSRVQNVVQELRGEKIDIISWHVDPAKYVCNALAPAEISRVIIDEENRTMEVIVPDDFLSIAIGKRGQNVRLASKLTGWRLDVKSEAAYNQAMQEGYDSLVNLAEMSISLADALYEMGYYSVEELSNANTEDLLSIRELDEEKAGQLIAAACEALVAMAEKEAAEAAAEGEEAVEAETEETTEEKEAAAAETEETTEKEEAAAAETEEPTEKEEAAEAKPRPAASDEPETQAATAEGTPESAPPEEAIAEETAKTASRAGGQQKSAHESE
jgi:N utilization substance protein A